MSDRAAARFHFAQLIWVFAACAATWICWSGAEWIIAEYHIDPSSSTFLRGIAVVVLFALLSIGAVTTRTKYGR